MSEKEWIEARITDTITKFGNEGRMNQYKDRLNQIFINTKADFKGRSPFCSSSTDSSGIKFATSDDEDDNNGDENAERGEEKTEGGEENGESMIVDDDEDDKHDAKKDEGAQENTNEGSSRRKNGAPGDNEGSSNLRDLSEENNEVSSRYKDNDKGNNERSERKDETDKVTSQKNFDDYIFEELAKKTDEELQKELKEAREKQAKLASNKLDELTDEEIFASVPDHEWEKFDTQKKEEEKQTDKATEQSSQKEKEKEEGPTSYKSREHIYEFTPGSAPSFNLGFDTPEEESTPKGSDKDDEDKLSRCLQSPYLYKRISTTEEITKDEILLARSIFCMQGDEA